jgi:hypothetical protein
MDLPRVKYPVGKIFSHLHVQVGTSLGDTWHKYYNRVSVPQLIAAAKKAEFCKTFYVYL